MYKYRFHVISRTCNTKNNSNTIIISVGATVTYNFNIEISSQGEEVEDVEEQELVIRKFTSHWFVRTSYTAALVHRHVG